MADAADPAVSFVVPARNEADYLGAALSSIRDQETDVPYEVVVVDGGSDDGTVAIAREHGARVVRQAAGGIGAARHLGAEATRGAWLAFVDADTVLRPDYLDAMRGFVAERALAAASSRCRLVGPRRAAVMQGVITHVFPRLSRPVLPGFNFFVAREAYEAAGGFPDVPNEDTAFSRRLGRDVPTGYHPEPLVATSARRIADAGLTGTLAHYLRLDWERLRADY